MTEKSARFNYIASEIEKAGAKLISLEKRKVQYICKCGKLCNSWDNNLLKKNFTGCATCANPFRKPEIQERIRQTNIKKFGFPNQFQSERVKQKIKETNMKNLGVENVMQDPKIFKLNQKSSYHNKKIYTFPSGKKSRVQGYEPRCLDILLEEYNEEEISVDAEKMPDIRYYNPRKKKICRYFPDIFILSKNIIIEVKSDFTYEKEKDINISKFKQCVSDGYIVYVYIFDKKSLIFKYIYNINHTITCIPFPSAKIVFFEN